MLIGLTVFYALYLLVLATLLLLLHLRGFYFFWSYGLSAVCSYLLTDFASRKLFNRVNIRFGRKYEIAHAITFVELIFSTAILGSLFNYFYQYFGREPNRLGGRDNDPERRHNFCALLSLRLQAGIS